MSDLSDAENAATQVSVAGIEKVRVDTEVSAIVLHIHQAEVRVSEKLLRLELQVEHMSEAIVKPGVKAVVHYRGDAVIVRDEQSRRDELDRCAVTRIVALVGNCVSVFEVIVQKV
jgi:hypothetical protein